MVTLAFSFQKFLVFWAAASDQTVGLHSLHRRWHQRGRDPAYQATDSLIPIGWCSGLSLLTASVI